MYASDFCCQLNHDIHRFHSFDCVVCVLGIQDGKDLGKQRIPRIQIRNATLLKSGQKTDRENALSPASVLERANRSKHGRLQDT